VANAAIFFIRVPLLQVDNVHQLSPGCSSHRYTT
jgi:hypothetical protein